jgi:hypothetical protein
VPHGRKLLSERLAALFLLPEGVLTVQVSFVTGSILVTYDDAELAEESVLQWVGTLWRLIGEHYDRLARLDAGEVDTVVSRITPLLQATLQENHSFDKRIALPEDVWT